jgi:drug/metabolite transporter (DMT)-like permease
VVLWAPLGIGALAFSGGLDAVGCALMLGSGGSRAGEGRAIWFAVATGALIAAYTVWDAYAIGRLDLSPVSYFWGAELCRTALLAPFALRLAPVSLVAPAREVSIVIGALLGSVVLAEQAGGRRVPAAIGVVGGVALLAWT